MFIQVIQGKVADADLLRRQMDTWLKELKPSASGFLGSTGGVTPDGRAITLARFESEEAARSNSDNSGQGSWWAETEKAYDGPVTFYDCREVDEILGGGSNDAGFVQIIQGRARDQEEMRRLGRAMETELSGRRPDILGGFVAWHGDGGGFTQAVYFRSEEEARKGEDTMADDELGSQFMEQFDGEPTFFDLPDPQLD